MKNGTSVYRVCYHDKLGFLKFGSYSTCFSSKSPDARGLYNNKKDAESRCKGYYYHKDERYCGSEFKVAKLEIQWQAEV